VNIENKVSSEFLINDYNLDLLEIVKPSGDTFSMYVTPRFTQSYTQGYEKFSTRIVKNFVKKCDLFIDVGANYGYYSLLAARANKDIRIIAVEPIAENFKVLNKNFIYNNIGTEHAKCINAAVSSSSGKIKFYKSEASDNSGVLPHPNSGTLEQLEVSSVSLDVLLKNDHYKHLFIKTDTEGHEMEVLKGLSATFKKCDDITILLEMNPKLFKLAGTSCKEVIEYLGTKGFSVYGIDDRESKYYPLDVADNLYKLEAEYPFFNALCVKKEKSLSVAFFSHSSALAGAERSLADLVEDLCNNFVLCSVLLPAEGPLKNVLQDKGAAVYVLPKYTHWWAGDNNSIIKEPQKLQLAQAMMAAVTGALPILRRVKPDIIFTQTIVAPWGALCAEILSIPHVLSVCEYGELDHHLKFYFSFQESIRALYDSSKAIFSITKSVKNEVFKGIKDKDNKIEVVYRNVRLAPNNDPDVTLQNYNYKNKSEIKIAIFGVICEKKGQEDIVRAGIELMKRGIRIKVYIIGYSDPHYLAFIKDLIGDSVFKENFIIKDFVNDPIKHMKEMDIVVSCSRNEAFGRTLFEAILLDKPIVYSNSGGPKEIYTDKKHGLAYKCTDEHSLVEKLLFVMDHPDKTRQRVKTAKEYVLKNFNRENYSGKIEFRLRQIKGLKIKDNHSMQALLSVDFLIDALQDEFERKDAARDGQIASLNQIILERDVKIASLNQVMAERDVQIAERDVQINAIMSSRSWKLTAPLRWIGERLRIIRGQMNRTQK
jgi:FkbM family methyltransferase